MLQVSLVRVLQPEGIMVIQEDIDTNHITLLNLTEQEGITAGHFIQEESPSSAIITNNSNLQDTIKANLCAYCGKEYKQSQSLQRHIRDKHRSGPYTCAFCNKTFSAKHNLPRHMLKCKKKLDN